MKLKDLLVLQVRRLETEPRDEHDIELARYLRRQLRDKYRYHFGLDFNKAGSQDLAERLQAVHELVAKGKKISEACRSVSKRSGVGEKDLYNRYHEYKAVLFGVFEE